MVLLIGGVAVLFFRNFFNPGFVNVTPAEAEALITSNAVTVIDVREPYEFEAGRIPSAKLIPIDKLPAALGTLNRDESYLLLCSRGGRSARGAALMVRNGFKTTKNMRGGMEAWRGKVVRGQ